MSRILEMAKADTQRIINNGGFDQELTITPTGAADVTVRGIATRHSQGFDNEGLPIVTTNCHCTFNEKDLNDQAVVTRNAKGDVIIQGWKIDFTDAIGTYSYAIAEAEPDNTLGIIRCKLVHHE